MSLPRSHPAPRGTRRSALAVALLAGWACAGCASFQPRPLEAVPFRERARTQERDGLRVTVAVPDREETDALFGTDLYDDGIQPVWIEIRNDSETPYVLLLSAVDPSYFSAREAARRSHRFLRPGTNARMDSHFASRGIEAFAPPGGSISGFVFSNQKLGTKEVRVRLQGPDRVESFEFYVPVPGFQADYHQVDWETLKAQEVTEFTEEEALREALRELPCCTTNALGLGEGDPVNLVVITPDETVLARALIRAGWDETERLTLGSAWRTFLAFFGGEYRYSPMSSLYLLGRPQDAGFQKARETIHERNHLRLWLSPLRFRGRQVWLGTITRDIGVYFTTRAWNLTTHAIDPNVDEARRYLREDFAVAQAIGRWGYVAGVGAASEERPHRNLMSATWWTDGLRLVMELAPEPRPLEEQGFFLWEWSGDSEGINRMLRALPPRSDRP